MNRCLILFCRDPFHTLQFMVDQLTHGLAGNVLNRDLSLIHIYNDSRIFEFASNEYVTKWKFYSLVTQKKSVTEGDSISNSSSILDIEFNKQQTFSNLLNLYNQVCDFCSFLSFRNSVSFEKVSLFKRIERDQKEFNVAFAECHIKEPDVISHRKLLNIIPVRSLEETVFKNILKNISKTDKKHKGLPLLIIPKDDMDAHTIDIGKIRHICSALEMELKDVYKRQERNDRYSDTWIFGRDDERSSP